MFEQKRRWRSRKSVHLLALVLGLLLVSNAIGYLLARDQHVLAWPESRLPDDEPMDFAQTFRIVLQTLSATIPQEIAGYSLVGAYPDELTLRYENFGDSTAMEVTLSENKFFYENRKSIGLPESYLIRKGVDGALLYETFGRGPDSDGISLNPYAAIREGIIARLRTKLRADNEFTALKEVFVIGDNKSGQIWRRYETDSKGVQLVEGVIHEPERLAVVSIRFFGPAKRFATVCKAFGTAIRFGTGEVIQNASLADACLSDLDHDIEPAWESGCRQAHLVALFISEGNTLPMARQLYGEYMTNNWKEGVKALYDDLHYEMYVTESWDKLIAQMEEENPWLNSDKPKTD